MGPETTVQTGVGQVRPRLRTIVVRRDAFGRIGQLIRALGLVVVSLVSLAAFCVVVSTSLDAGGKWASVGIVVGELAVLAWAVAGTAIVLWLGRLWGQREIKGHRRRLEWMAQQPDAARRVPHRLVELVYLRHARRIWMFRRRLIRDLGRLLGDIPLGRVILVQSTCGVCLRNPEVTGIPFEPLELTCQDDRAAALIERAWPAGRVPERMEQSPEHQSADEKVGLIRRIGRNVHVWFRSWVSVITLTLLVVAAFRRRDWAFLRGVAGLILVVAFALAVVLGAYLVYRVMHMLAGRTWWAVPGGLIWRSHRVWWRSDRSGAIRRSKTSLVVDLRGWAVGLVDRQSQMARWFVVGEAWRCQVVALIAAAWFCDARTPTAEEVAAFTGPEAVVEGE
ncbi:MAG: hypothetical protein JXB13_03950 [Phycisphaerae bacterium]|nr:hypothetical protein [Phycisphaerae bacterium]